MDFRLKSRVNTPETTLRKKLIFFFSVFLVSNDQITHTHTLTQLADNDYNAVKVYKHTHSRWCEGGEEKKKPPSINSEWCQFLLCFANTIKLTDEKRDETTRWFFFSWTAQPKRSTVGDTVTGESVSVTPAPVADRNGIQLATQSFCVKVVNVILCKTCRRPARPPSFYFSNPCQKIVEGLFIYEYWAVQNFLPPGTRFDLIIFEPIVLFYNSVLIMKWNCLWR